MAVAFIKVAQSLKTALQEGDTATCVIVTSAALAALPESPFHTAIDLTITNPLDEVAAFYDAFFQSAAARITTRAAYTEMNDFDFGTARWYAEVFAYQSYGGHEDYDWLADYQAAHNLELTITGFESLQKIYANPAFRNPPYRDAVSIATFLVICKFQDLIRRAAPLMKELHFPLLATAHDSDFIYETPAAIIT